MTKEDKDLLLKYLCMALPYKVMIEYNNDGYLSTRELGLGSLHDFMCDNAECKPYLRPMSSMSKEEKEEYNKTFCVIHGHGSFCTIDTFDYLISHGFDIYDLIPKGLAIEVTEEK